MSNVDKRKQNDALASFNLSFTDEQKAARKVCHDNKVTILTGKPGTAKSTIAASVAIEYFKSKAKNVEFDNYIPKHEVDCSRINKIIVTRPIEEAGKKIGFLPGDMEEKLEPYITPILDVIDELVGGDKSFTQELKDKGKLQIIPLQFMRGRTFKNCIILLDEGQNADLQAFKLLASRLGRNAKLIITSDWRQIDLDNSRNSMCQWFDKILKLNGVETFELTENFRDPLAIQITDILIDAEKEQIKKRK